MEHKMGTTHNSFESIKTGKKKVHMRLLDKKRMSVRPNDVIIFKDLQNSETLMARVDSIHLFPTFDELYAFFAKDKLGYEEYEPAHPSDMLAYFDREDQKKLGVVGFVISLIDEP